MDFTEGLFIFLGDDPRFQDLLRRMGSRISGSSRRPQRAESRSHSKPPRNAAFTTASSCQDATWPIYATHVMQAAVIREAPDMIEMRDMPGSWRVAPRSLDVELFSSLVGRELFGLSLAAAPPAAAQDRLFDNRIARL